MVITGEVPDPYDASPELRALRALYASAWVEGAFRPEAYDQAEELRWVLGQPAPPILVHSPPGTFLNRPWFIQAPHWMLGHEEGSRWLDWLGKVAGSSDPPTSPLSLLWAAERFLKGEADQTLNLNSVWEIEQQWFCYQVKADATGVRTSRGHQEGCGLCFPKDWVR